MAKNAWYRRPKKASSKSRGTVHSSARPIVVKTGGGGGRPIVVKQTAAPTRRKSGGRRRRSGGSSFGSHELFDKPTVAALAGAWVLGYLDKQGTKLPTIPLVGRAGTVGLALYFGGKHLNMPQVKKACVGPLSIALYQLGRDGKVAGIDGDYSDGDDVSGTHDPI